MTKSKYIARLSEIIKEYLSNSKFNNDSIKTLLSFYRQKFDSDMQSSTKNPNYVEGQKVVYANNFLNMKNVKVIGFDLDYTLVTYTGSYIFEILFFYFQSMYFIISKLLFFFFFGIRSTEELQNLIYSLAQDSLIKGHAFPKSLQSCKFDKEFAIRGLSIDLKTGDL